MKRIQIAQLHEYVGTTATIAGFVHEIRDQSKIKFILVRDNSGIVQTITLPECNAFESIARIPKESVIQLTGLVKQEKQAPNGIEIEVNEYLILNEPVAELPIPVHEKSEPPSLPVRLDWRWIDLRKPANTLIFKIWTDMEALMRDYFLQQGFIQIHSPKFVAGATESGAELFTVDYFGKTASLAQSPQFYKQMAMAAGFEKVFEIGPVFRANKSHTTRHDTEFTSVDIEMSYIESHEDVMKVEEDWLQYVLRGLHKKYAAHIKTHFDAEIIVPTLPFPRLTFEDAMQILQTEYNHTCDGDFDPRGEKLLFDYVTKKFNHEFVFITDWPSNVRPFYHMRSKDGLTQSFDLLWKGLEITTGAKREHRFTQLIAQANEKNIPLGGIQSYLEFFKYGCPPHGGFGLSPTRLLMLMLGLSNVREATFVARDTHRLTP